MLGIPGSPPVGEVKKPIRRKMSDWTVPSESSFNRSNHTMKYLAFLFPPAALLMVNKPQQAPAQSPSDALLLLSGSDSRYIRIANSEADERTNRIVDAIRNPTGKAAWTPTHYCTGIYY
jgi:hypothetical protein